MASIVTMPSLAISLLLRIDSEERRIAMLADNVTLVLFTHFMLSFWPSLLLVVSAFIGLAFYETRVEYGNPKGNVRELGPETSNGKEGIPLEADGIPTTHSSLPPDASPAMCPINPTSFNLFRSTANNSDSLAQNREGVIPENIQGFGPETTDLTNLHGKPILFPCHLRHRRVSPFKDNFQHSYLYAGAPVGLHNTYRPIYSIDDPPKPNSWLPGGWFNFRAQDHAIRGGTNLTLSQKLREFLLSEVSLST